MRWDLLRTYISILCLVLPFAGQAQDVDCNQEANVEIAQKCIPKDAERVDLSYSKLTDLSVLAAFTNVKYLNLEFNPVSDLGPLTSLTTLEELYLHEMRGGDPLDLTPLTKLGNLRVLDIGLNEVKDPAVLSELINLEELTLPSVNLESLNDLAGLDNLKTLQLQDYTLNDQELVLLSQFDSIEKVYINTRNVTDYSPLMNMTNLQIFCPQISECLLGDNIRNMSAEDIKRLINDP